MKKLLLTFALIACTAYTFAQDAAKFGVTGGLLHSSVNFDFTLGNLSATNNTGFYLGLAVDIPASESFHIQPELTYGSAGDLGFVFLPVMAKFYASENFYLLGGPQLSFSTTLNDIKDKVRSAIEIIDEDYNGTIESVLKNVGVDLGFGAGYEIDENFAIQARYSFEVSNRYDGPGSGFLKLRARQFNLGVLYSFQ